MQKSVLFSLLPLTINTYNKVSVYRLQTILLSQLLAIIPRLLTYRYMQKFPRCLCYHGCEAPHPQCRLPASVHVPSPHGHEAQTPPWSAHTAVSLLYYHLYFLPKSLCSTSAGSYLLSYSVWVFYCHSSSFYTTRSQPQSQTLSHTPHHHWTTHPLMHQASFSRVVAFVMQLKHFSISSLKYYMAQQ